ncbi:MAG: hypothetical protein NPIRA01_03270 [Nitrospirales bacterium]|nr:MAG: hypothetical protein NPIRA01_03270 [Nitrospirales bacterium]
MTIFSPILCLVVAVGLCTLLSPLVNAQSNTEKTYSFKVFLEDEEIGQQNFVVSSNEPDTKIEIDARFEVKYLFITAYSYRHTNTEVWNGKCLEMIRSQTNDNGKSLFVQGTFTDNQMKLLTHDGIRTVSGCTKTFAYWDRDFLLSQSLLNSQTGELNQIKVKELGEEMISVRSQATPATHYEVEADKFSIDIWYASNGEWVSLQSTTESDSKLIYVLQ